ncbi:MAG: hypothetical protein AAGA67_01895, partial [Cyanobacteria bacterium P01_F01_bin.153]
NFGRWLRKGLTHPVTAAVAIATFAHGLVLAIPVPDTKESKPEPTPKKTIKITSLVATVPPESKPKPKEEQKPKPKREKPKPERKKSDKLQAKKQPAPTPMPAPSPAPSPSPSPTPSPQASPTPEPTPSPSGLGEGGDGNGGDGGGNGLVSVLREQILARLLKGSNDPTATEAYMDSVPGELIKDDQRPFFVTGEGADSQLVDLAADSLAIQQIRVDDVYYDYVLPILTEDLGYLVEPQDPEYGGARLYFADSEGDNPPFYFSMMKLGSGTFLVIWNDDPRGTEG